jgi:RNA polymerase sigma factor (sigma-70 family)
MSESLDKLSADELTLIQSLFEPLNKNPLNSEDLNPMAKVYRQKMGYSEPVVFTDDDDAREDDSQDSDFPAEGEVASDLWSDEEEADSDFGSDSDSTPAPPSFKSFDDDDIDLDEVEINEKVKIELNKTLSVLDDRERMIIESYFGVNTDCEPMTLEAIGEKYNLTKERIRQIKEKAIRKLRHNAHALQSLMNE